MKVNFNRPFTDFKGQAMCENGTPLMMSEGIGRELFQLGRSEHRSAEDKYMAYKLCNRISSASGDVDLTAEEGAFIVDVCAGSLTAGAYGQVKDLIDGNE